MSLSRGIYTKYLKKVEKQTVIRKETNYLRSKSQSYFLVNQSIRPVSEFSLGTPPSGLNNIPICTVNDDENSLEALHGVSQFNHLEKDKIPFAKSSHPPSTAGPKSPIRGVSPALNSVKVHPPRPNSEPCRNTKECFKTCNENPFIMEKEEMQVEKPRLPPKSHSTAGSCSSEVRDTKTNVDKSTVCIPNYLDQEIKILAKLCNIVHTDSLAEVLQWLLRASSKEKEWVSALIHAELAEINLLAHPRLCPRRNISAGPAAVIGKPAKVKLPSDSPTKSKVLTRSREGHQPTRVSNQGSEENKEVPKEVEHKPPLFIRRNEMTIPVAEYFSKPNSPPRPKTQESISTKPMSARSVQGYNLSPQRTFSPLTYQR